MGNAYDNASLIVTPNGYKASKIYALKPTDGSSDLSFSRASTALRRNSSGVWESVASNVPRLNYPIGGGCPSWLFEPQATNIFLNSNAPATQAVTVANATVYTISIRGIGVVTLSGAATGVITGTNSEGSSLTVTTSSTSLIVTVSGLSGTVYVQVETGSAATSPIITAGSAVTRLVDFPIGTMVQSTTGYTIFTNVKTLTGIGLGDRYVFDISNSSGRQGIFNFSQTNKCEFAIYLNSTFVNRITSINNIINGFNKVALTFNGSTYKLFLNGVLEGSVNAIGGYPNAYQLPQNFSDPNGNILQNYFEYYTTAISDTEAIALTT